ncbi:MAG: PASTA domain-containing protein [Chloroflexota bacterium]|nr:MAG: PASTA domain-containing protein [Chloroflexota bacterium]
MGNNAPQRESRLVLVLLGVLLLCLCLAAVTVGLFLLIPAAPEMQAPDGSNPPRARIEIEPTLAAARVWNEVFHSQFERYVESSSWFIGKREFGLDRMQAKLNRGAYEWEIESIFGQKFWVPGTRDKFGIYDVQVSVEPQKNSGFRYGLVLGLQDSTNLYLLELVDEESVIFSAIENGTEIELDKWHSPTNLRTGGRNSLRAIVDDSHFTFLINDEYVGEFQDNRFPSGRLGVVGGLTFGNLNGNIRFDDFRVRVPSHLTTPTFTPLPDSTPLPLVTAHPTLDGILVPPLVGLTPEGAIEKLALLGLQGEVVVQSTPTCAGLVMSQATNPGTRVPRGATIRFFSCRSLTPTP